MKPKFYYSELDNYNEEHLKRIILYLKEVIECTDPLLKKLEEDSAVDTALKCYKKELEEKIKKIKWDRDTTQDFDEVINKILELI
jgi:hypothetical protein